MEVFHYARFTDLYSIRHGSEQSEGMTGLIGKKKRRSVENVEDLIGVYALMEPIPKVWTENKVFPDIWQKLRRKVGKLLLTIDVDPESAYVLDCAHIAGFESIQANHKDHMMLAEDPPSLSISQEFAHGTYEDSLRAYVGSKILIRDYIMMKVQYTVPEVFIPGDVPLERISISDTQPYLSNANE